MPVVSSNITAKYLGCGEVEELRHRSEKLRKLNDILEHNTKLEHDPNTNYDRVDGLDCVELFLSQKAQMVLKVLVHVELDQLVVQLRAGRWHPSK